jgi:hypothetical protein
MGMYIETKLILHCSILFLCLLLPAGCDLSKDANSDFTIKVCGTEGLKFSGHYSIVGTKILPEPVNAQGVIPIEYKGRGGIALCNFRKLTTEGSLKVEILKNGKVISESETSLPYGFVSLKTPIPEKNTIITQIMRKLFSKE